MVDLSLAALMMTNGTPARLLSTWAIRQNSDPSISGMFKSLKIRSGLKPQRDWRAAFPFSAVITRKPAWVRASAIMVRMLLESSTTITVRSLRIGDRFRISSMRSRRSDLAWDFPTYAAAPSLKPSSICFSSSLTLSMMMGMELVPGFFLSFSHSANPSIPGISTSVMIRSNSPVRAISNP